MDPLTLAALGGVLGLAKSQFIDKPQLDKARQYDATVNRYSPWTKNFVAPPASAPDYFGNAASGGAGGLIAGQSPWLMALLNGAKPGAGQVDSNGNPIVTAGSGALDSNGNPLSGNIAQSSSPWGLPGGGMVS